MSVVYRKTAKGLAEIGTRVFGLSLRLRQALILVDGRKSAVELDKLILANQASALTALLADGFIEEVATVVDVPLDLVAPPAPPAPPAVSLDTHKRQAARYMIDKLGPHAEHLAIKLERAKTVSELQPLLGHAVQALRSVGRGALAEEFITRFVTPLQG